MVIRRDYYDPMWHLPHYYGDSVRKLLIWAAALMLFASPLYGSGGILELPLEIIGALIFVVLAAIASPRTLWAFVASGISSAIGLVIFETWAIQAYSIDTSIAFVLREAIALVLLFALYLSVKTTRAMMLHQVGTNSPANDLAEPIGEEGEEYEPGDPMGVNGEYDSSSSDNDSSSY